MKTSTQLEACGDVSDQVGVVLVLHFIGLEIGASFLD